MSEYEQVVTGWQAEAREKNLPEKFVESLAGSDAVTEAEKAKIVANISSAADLKTKRDAAIDLGRRYGEDEASRRREVSSDREQRIKRAMAYAAWEFDGKPMSSKPQREEMGVLSPDITPSLERALTAPERPKKEKTGFRK